ncbi:MAG: hypothetical protein ABDH20_01425 [Thermus sp.]
MATRRLREFLEAREALAWKAAAEVLEAEAAWQESPHAQGIYLPPLFRAFLWLLGRGETPATWQEVRVHLSQGVEFLERASGGDREAVRWWRAVFTRLRYLYEAVGEGQRWLLPSDWLPGWPSLGQFRGWAKAVAEFLEERGLELLPSKGALLRALEALLDEIDRQEQASLEVRVQAWLLSDAGYQAARDALGLLEEVRERRGFSREATAALGMAAALGKSSSVATPAEVMSRGAEAALEAAARWRKGGIPYAFWVFAHAEHRVGEWLARQKGWGTAAEVLPLDALRDEEGELLEEFLPADDLQEDTLWRMAVHAGLERAGLDSEEIYILLEWAQGGDEVLREFFGPGGLLEAGRKWLRGTLERLRQDAFLRDLWGDLGLS